MPAFTLRDLDGVLAEEDHPTIAAAFARTHTPLWIGRPWHLTDHNGAIIGGHSLAWKWSA